MRVVAALLFILITSAAAIANRSVQETNQKLSASEEREVREFVKRVAANIEKTRDLSPYLNNPPARNLFLTAIADPDDPVRLVDKDVARKVGSHEMLRFYIALWNITYLSDSYVLSRFLVEKTALRDLLPQQRYPHHVVTFLEQDPTLKRWWKNFNSSDSETRIPSVAEFHSVSNRFQDATILMRAYFRRHPPEHSAIYKQNLTHLRHFLNEISVETCENELTCVGLPLRTQTIEVNLPAVQLCLVRLNGRLQVLFIGPHDD